MSESTMTRLVDDSLFVSDAPVPTLRGGRCVACNTTTFPHQASCPRCGGEQMAEVPLPRAGRLWSFTVQGFEPKPPYRGSYTEYGVGYVDLGPVIVEALLTENDPAALSVGAAMTLTLVDAYRDDDGTDVRTFAFAKGDAPA